MSGKGRFLGLAAMLLMASGILAEETGVVGATGAAAASTELAGILTVARGDDGIITTVSVAVNLVQDEQCTAAVAALEGQAAILTGTLSNEGGQSLLALSAARGAAEAAAAPVVEGSVELAGILVVTKNEDGTVATASLAVNVMQDEQCTAAIAALEGKPAILTGTLASVENQSIMTLSAFSAPEEAVLPVEGGSGASAEVISEPVDTTSTDATEPAGTGAEGEKGKKDKKDKKEPKDKAEKKEPKEKKEGDKKKKKGEEGGSGAEGEGEGEM